MNLFPVGKILHICDDVLADPTSHKPSLLNLWEVIRVPPEANFPYLLAKICVVALVRDGEGDVRFRVDLVHAATSEVIRRSRDYTVRIVDRHRSTLVVIRLQDVMFPEPGTYFVELSMGDTFFDDRPISVLATEPESQP